MSSSSNLTGIFRDALQEHLAVIRNLEAQQESCERAALLIGEALSFGNKVLWCGNGGSAADSQHLAAELVGRFRHDHRPLPSIALTTDSSVLTAISNDFGYDDVFLRQVEALCVPGDVLVGISTSGNSRNVCQALQKARQLGAFTIAMSGESGGEMATLADISILVPSRDPARIQEAHILCGHILCEWIEAIACRGDIAQTCGAAQ